jgi:hypothetical protein
VAGVLPRSDLLNTVLEFSAVAAIPLWVEGRVWRRRRLDTGLQPRIMPSGPNPSPAIGGTYPLYPAITACLSEGRRPDHEEVRVVASRIWREGFALRFAPDTRAASFATRRVLLRVARAALIGADALPNLSVRSRGRP